MTTSEERNPLRRASDPGGCSVKGASVRLILSLQPSRSKSEMIWIGKITLKCQIFVEIPLHDIEMADMRRFLAACRSTGNQQPPAELRGIRKALEKAGLCWWSLIFNVFANRSIQQGLLALLDVKQLVKFGCFKYFFGMGTTINNIDCDTLSARSFSEH